MYNPKASFLQLQDWFCSFFRDIWSIRKFRYHSVFLWIAVTKQQQAQLNGLKLKSSLTALLVSLYWAQKPQIPEPMWQALGSLCNQRKSAWNKHSGTSPSVRCWCFHATAIWATIKSLISIDIWAERKQLHFRPIKGTGWTQRSCFSQARRPLCLQWEGDMQGLVFQLMPA